MKAKHRRPELPHWKSPKGSCRWCGERITEGARILARRWHRACVTAYKIACWPAQARFHVWVKDKGICQLCRHDLAADCAAHPWNVENENLPVEHFRKVLCNWGPRWQCDHIVPLIEANRNDLSLWSLSNLRVLCDGCHKGETRALAARRAAKRQEVVS